MSNTEDTPDTLHHFSAGQINGVRITPTPRHSSTTGYGSKIPTGYMLQTFGPRPVWRRVYVINYGNAGSTYVLISGARHYLSPGVELILETVRDGGTLEGARELMAAWPVWMKESEGLPATAPEVAPALEPGDTFTTPDGRGLLVQFVTPTDDGLKLDGRWIAEDGSIEAIATYYLEHPGYTPAAPAYRVGQHVKLIGTHPGDGGWSTAYIEGTYGSQYKVRVQGHSLYVVPASKLAPLDTPEGGAK